MAPKIAHRADRLCRGGQLQTLLLAVEKACHFNLAAINFMHAGAQLSVHGGSYVHTST